MPLRIRFADMFPSTAMPARSPSDLLLGYRQVHVHWGAGNGDSLGCRLAVLAAGLDCVLSRRNVLDDEIAILVRHRKIGSRDDKDVAGHLGMHIAKQRYIADLGEGEGLRQPLRPGAHVVSELLIVMNCWPIDIVAHVVIVLEFDRCALLDDN